MNIWRWEMYNSPLQQVLEAGRKAFLEGRERIVPRRLKNLDMMSYAFLKGWDEMAADFGEKKAA